MAVQIAKRLLRKEVKLRISNLSEDEKLRQSKVVTHKVRMNVLIVKNISMDQWRFRRWVSPGAVI